MSSSITVRHVLFSVRSLTEPETHLGWLASDPDRCLFYSLVLCLSTSFLLNQTEMQRIFFRIPFGPGSGDVSWHSSLRSRLLPPPVGLSHLLMLSVWATFRVPSAPPSQILQPEPQPFICQGLLALLVLGGRSRGAMYISQPGQLVRCLTRQKHKRI